MRNFSKILTIILSLIMFENANSKEKQETAILAGGCFWGMEELFSKVDGIVKTNVGYTGGNVSNPSYSLITTGLTGHAEAIEIIFDLIVKHSFASLPCMYRTNGKTCIRPEGSHSLALFYDPDV